VTEVAIDVVELAHRYGDKQVLHDVGFQVRWGEICGYLGPNGAGKSTTLKALVGLLRPSEGRVRIDGHDPASEDLTAREMIGYVSHEGGLYPLLSVREHLTLVADLHELDETQSTAKTDELIALFEMKDFVDKRIDSLSRGQRQRVALSCALLHDPKILLLDEPLTGLDVSAARALRAYLRQMADQGCAVLYSSHILDVVERVCDRAIILSGGRIVADAPTTELVQRSADKTLESVFHALTRTENLDDLKGAFD
jgi:ABC-2 type transport system ATP-binding protein